MKVKINNTVGGYRKGQIVEDTPSNLKILLDRGYATEIKAVKDGEQSTSQVQQTSSNTNAVKQDKSETSSSTSSERP